MNAKTLEAIRRHGESLLAAFPNATERDPVALCKKLRRIETAVSRVTTLACNEPMPEAQLDAACDKALDRVAVLLGMTVRDLFACGLFVNRDPRGYALKFGSDWTRDYNDGLRRNGKCMLTIYRDMGGYGIIAPDLTA